MWFLTSVDSTCLNYTILSPNAGLGLIQGRWGTADCNLWATWHCGLTVCVNVGVYLGLGCVPGQSVHAPTNAHHSEN